MTAVVHYHLGKHAITLTLQDIPPVGKVICPFLYAYSKGPQLRHPSILDNLFASIHLCDLHYLRQNQYPPVLPRDLQSSHSLV